MPCPDQGTNGFFNHDDDLSTEKCTPMRVCVIFFTFSLFSLSYDICNFFEKSLLYNVKNQEGVRNDACASARVCVRE